MPIDVLDGGGRSSAGGAAPAPSLDPASPLTAGCAVALLLDRIETANLGSVGGTFRAPGGRIVDGAYVPSPYTQGPNVAAGIGSSVAYATPAGAFSIFGRVRIDADPADDQSNIMSFYGDEGGGAGFQIRLGNTGAAGERRRVCAPSGQPATNAIAPGAWTDFAVTIDGAGNGVHYLGGAANGTFAGAFGGSAAATMWVGVVTAFRRPFLGTISDLRVWHGRWLTPAEIATLHANPRAGILNAPPPPTGPFIPSVNAEPVEEGSEGVHGAR